MHVDKSSMNVAAPYYNESNDGASHVKHLRVSGFDFNSCMARIRTTMYVCHGAQGKEAR